MKKSFLFLIFSSAVLFSGHHASAADESHLPEHVKKILDNNALTLQRFLEQCNQHPDAHKGTNVMYGDTWLPGYYIKYGIHRFANAQKIKEVIRADNLHSLEAPEKYLYHVPGRPDDLSDENYVVIAKEVIDSDLELSDEQAQQLLLCSLKTGVGDLHTHNWVVTKDGKVVIIDTGIIDHEPATILTEIPRYIWKKFKRERRNVIAQRKKAAARRLLNSSHAGDTNVLYAS